MNLYIVTLRYVKLVNRPSLGHMTPINPLHVPECVNGLRNQYDDHQEFEDNQDGNPHPSFLHYCHKEHNPAEAFRGSVEPIRRGHGLPGLLQSPK